MIELTDENVIDECYSILCRVEAALSDPGYYRIYEVEDKLHEWHDIVEEYMIALKTYINKKENSKEFKE